jgi:23S rRNA (pseudouridine1915-N3)-methyltransferase
VIEKGSKDNLYQPIIQHFIKISKPYAKINLIDLFPKSVIKAQNKGVKEIQNSYSKALEKYVTSSKYSVILDPTAEQIDSVKFSQLLKDKQEISFFIGGAYGFEKSFLYKSNKAISFGKITLSHKLTKVILMEQIFRGLSILNNHPYHK